MPIVKWMDLSKVNVFLGSYRDANNESGLCIVDGGGQFDDAIKKMGFAPASGAFSDRIYMMQNFSITPEMARKAFGEDSLKLISADSGYLNKKFSEKVKEVTDFNAKSMFAQQRPIGVNDLGDVVQESVSGRFFLRTVDGKSVVTKEVVGVDPALFLRAVDKGSLARITKGFVMRITGRNEKLRREHIQRLMTVSNEADFTPREYQESIEASLNALFRDQFSSLYVAGANVDPLASFDVANAIYLGMPELKERTPNSIANQQYSTPVPMAALAQSLLARRADLSGASILEPTIGNANLVSILNLEVAADVRCRIFGVEIDSERADQAAQVATQVVLGDATNMDFKSLFEQPEGFDFVIANPPFGSLDGKEHVKLPAGSLIDEIDVGRIDHLIMLRSLNARRAGGRAVFITGADSVLGKGEIKGRSKHVLNYLYDHYDVEGVADIAGELYKKQGAEFPIRIFVIGPRKAAPEQTLVPETLPVIRTYEALRQWAGDVIGKQNPLSFDSGDLLGASVVVSESGDLTAGASAVSDTLASTSDGSPQAAEAKADSRQDSEFQQRYVAFSNVSEASTMIPANLSGPVYEALAMIKEAHGDIDEYVGRELDFAFKDLQSYFSPEQVDAMAMIFHAHDRKLGFLLADQMGVGKGRVLAAVARREVKAGRIPMFVTITPNLFSDFLERDLVAIGSRDLFVNPLIVNDGVKTVDSNGDVMVKALGRPAYRIAAASGRLPEGTDMVLLTYSQLSSTPQRNLTSRYMREICETEPMSLILDESHTGAGASNTGVNLEAMIDNIGTRGSVTYSSGTPIKGAKNLRLYKKILPAGVNTDDLLEAVNADPLSLQEALNYEIASQGCLISRELDNTGIEKEFPISENVERNRAISDQMSQIFSAMCYLSGDVATIVKKQNKKFEKILSEVPEEERAGNRMGASSMNFGSRLHELSRQFLLSIKAIDVVKHVREALEANKKPIVPVQHTGDALLQDFVVQANMDGTSDDGSSPALISSVVLDEPVTFKDLMRKYLRKISWIKTQGRYGDVSYEQVKTVEAVEAMKALEVLIDALPNDLPLTPIDYMREEMAKLGYTVGEVSGRNLRMVTLPNGKVEIGPIPGRMDKTRVNRVVREFNNGECDVLMLTGSGSTGLSVQSSPANGKDVRIRRMIKWEMQPNIAAERQIDGRHNRTGQINTPEYCVPMTGLAADDRLGMMFNNKNRSLTASTVANRDSKEIIRKVPDLLNVVGDMAAQVLLFENPALAERLSIDIGGDHEEMLLKPALWYCNKLSGRVPLLFCAEQDALYDSWQGRFVEMLDKLKAEGKNPLEVECHEWKAKVVNRSVFMGAKNKTENVKSQFNSPIYLTELSYEKTMQAVKATEVDRKVMLVNGETSMLGEDGTKKTIVNTLRRNRTAVLERYLSKKHTSVDEALQSGEANEVRNMAMKLDWLDRNLPHLKNGAVFYREDLEGKEVANVVIRHSLPGKVEGFARLSDYGIYTMQPGSDQIEMYSLSTLYAEDSEIEPNAFEQNTEAREAFDIAENGIVMKKAMMLDGNLFEATTLNLREHIGRKVVYTDDVGSRQHGILIRSDFSVKKLMDLPERLKDRDLLVEIMFKQGHPISSHYSGNWRNCDDGVTLFKHSNGDVILAVPKTKSKGGEVFLDPALSKIAGQEEKNEFDLRFSVAAGKMQAKVPISSLNNVIDFLIARKNINFFVRDREVIKAARDSLESKNEYVAVIA